VVGSRILTRLGEDDAVRLVPDRLTYLAAARSLPSQLIGGNWSRNEQWRDSFVTGLDVTPHAYEADAGIADRVDQHLQALYQAEQSTLYNALLRPESQSGSPNGRVEPGSLYELLEELTARKTLLRSYMLLAYPQFMLDSGDIRGGLEGRGSLLDRVVMRRFREANVAVSSINQRGVARLDLLQATWSRQPEAARRSGSSALSLAHAMVRLNALDHEHFARQRISQGAAHENGDQTTCSSATDRCGGLTQASTTPTPHSIAVAAQSPWQEPATRHRGSAAWRAAPAPSGGARRRRQQAQHLNSGELASVRLRRQEARIVEDCDGHGTALG
jgi:hypothetical protein